MAVRTTTAARCVARAARARARISNIRRRYVPSVLVGSDFFALSLGLDMVDVGGFVVAAAIVVVEMTSPGDLTGGR